MKKKSKLLAVVHNTFLPTSFENVIGCIINTKIIHNIKMQLRFLNVLTENI